MADMGSGTGPRTIVVIVIIGFIILVASNMIISDSRTPPPPPNPFYLLRPLCCMLVIEVLLGCHHQWRLHHLPLAPGLHFMVGFVMALGFRGLGFSV